MVGATASVAFAFEATGAGDARAEPFSLRGRILLIPGDDNWSVFGYDVAREDVSAQEARS